MNRPPQQVAVYVLPRCFSCYAGLPQAICFGRPLSSVFIEALGAVAQAADDSPHDDASGPTEPHSPSLPADLMAPTPRVELEEVEPGRAVITMSRDALARTSAPGSDASLTAAPAFNPELIPVLQHRVLCALSHLPVSLPAGSPLLPAGCPIIIHNPFSDQSQCRLVASTQGSAQVLLHTLGDYANRRGWQPIVAVQPQPDSHAIHLIPTAANPELASVLLRGETGLQPTCIRRGFPSNNLGRVSYQGRRGQLVAPYPTARHFRLPVQVRDGDCLRVNTGPFGPPRPRSCC